MARRIDEFSFSGGGGRDSVYPWDDWLDGGVWELRRGEDFTISAANFQSSAYTSARSRGKTVTVRVRGDLVQMQAREATAEERAEWKVRSQARAKARAKAQERAKARREREQAAAEVAAKAATAESSPEGAPSAPVDRPPTVVRVPVPPATGGGG